MEEGFLVPGMLPGGLPLGAPPPQPPPQAGGGAPVPMRRDPALAAASSAKAPGPLGPMHKGERRWVDTLGCTYVQRAGRPRAPAPALLPLRAQRRGAGRALGRRRPWDARAPACWGALRAGLARAWTRLAAAALGRRLAGRRPRRAPRRRASSGARALGRRPRAGRALPRRAWSAWSGRAEGAALAAHLARWGARALRETWAVAAAAALAARRGPGAAGGGGAAGLGATAAAARRHRSGVIRPSTTTRSTLWTQVGGGLAGSGPRLQGMPRSHMYLAGPAWGNSRQCRRLVAESCKTRLRLTCWPQTRRTALELRPPAYAPHGARRAACCRPAAAEQPAGRLALRPVPRLPAGTLRCAVLSWTGLGWAVGRQVK